MPIVVPSSSSPNPPSRQSVLTLFQTALQGLGVAGSGQPTSVVGNASADVVQALALVTAAGDEVARSFQWQAMTNECRFTTVFYQYTANNTSGQATLTGMSSVTGLDATFGVTGTGIPQDTYIKSVDSSSQITLTNSTTNGGSTATYTFTRLLYNMPSDFDRLIDRTDYDKSKHWEMLGPQTAQQWQWLKSAYISTGPRIRFRPLGNYFQIWPNLGAAELLGFEYISKNWILASTDQTPSKKLFSADTDSCVFPDALMIALIKLKYYEAKGLDTTNLAKAYNDQLDLAKAHDQGSPTLSMSPRISSVLIGWENIPDSNYGS